MREGLWQSEEEEKPTPCGTPGLVRSKEMRQRGQLGYPWPLCGLGCREGEGKLDKVARSANRRSHL